MKKSKARELRKHPKGHQNAERALWGNISCLEEDIEDTANFDSSSRSSYSDDHSKREQLIPYVIFEKINTEIMTASLWYILASSQIIKS